MEKKERKDFERYLVYKNRKKLGDIYKCFLQNSEPESINYALKRKKIDRNIRYNLNELLELVKKFWVDKEDPKSTTMSSQIFNVINFAGNLHKRGMFEPALEQLRLAEQISNDNYAYPFAYYASKKRAVFSWMQFPEESERIFEELRVKQDAYLNSMTLDSKITYLNERALYLLFYKGVWMLNEEQLTFLNGVENTILKLLKTKGLTNNFKVGLLLNLGNLSLLIKMDGESACKYATEIVNTLNNSSSLHSFKDINKIVSYEFLLLMLMLVSKKEAFASHYLDLITLIDKQANLTPTSSYLYSHSILYNVILNISDDKLFHQDIEKVHFFFEEFGAKMSSKFIGSIQRSLFEIYYYRGDFENATVCLDKLKEVNNVKKPDLKFLEFTAEVLLAYEKGEDEFIINRCHSFRRGATKFLTYNPAGNLFISCFIKLCKTNNPAERKNILLDFKLKMEPLLGNIRHRYMLHIYHIIPWAESKINEHPTVLDYLRAKENKG